MSTVKNPTFTFDLTQIHVVSFQLPLNIGTSKKNVWESSTVNRKWIPTLLDKKYTLLDTAKY
jgi:hypothetical protein